MRLGFYLILTAIILQTSIMGQLKNNGLTQNKISARDIEIYDRDAGIPVNVPQLAPKSAIQNSPLALSGNYTIGVTFSGNPNNYLTLSAAVADLQAQGVSGPVTFEFTDAVYNDTSVVIGGYAGQGAANPVLFKKASSISSVKINFNGLRTFGIRLDSASYVSFEGSTTVGQRPLTFEVDSSIARNLVVITRSNNIRFEGIELIGFRRFSDLSAATIVAQTFVTGSTLTNSNITYTNLLLKRGSTCFGGGGISTTARDNNVLISNCDFGGDTFMETFSSRGLSLSMIDNLTVYKNNIRRGKNYSAATTGPIGIIFFGGMNNLVISHNQIHDLEKVGTTAGNTSGIRLQTNGPGVYTNTKIFNNMVYDLRNPNGVNASAVQAIEGIAVTSTSPNPFNVVEIYNNTVHLTGSIGASTPSYTAGMLFSTSLTADTVKVFNNIISNEMLTPNNGGSVVYADFIHASTSGGLGNYRQLANRNVYWYPNINGFLNLYSNDFADWQATTFQDANSINLVNPNFVGPTDPHININAISPADGNASPVAYITNDIDLQVRSLTTPDIGADEYTYVAPSVSNPVSFNATPISGSQINLSFVKNANNNNVVIVWNLTGTFSTPSGTPPAAGQPFAGGTMLSNASSSPVSHTGLSSGTRYYYKAFSYDGLGNYSLGLTADATTLCDPYSLPYSQSFDGASFPPQCWQLENAGLGNNWTRTATSTYSGAGAMRYSYNSTNAANAWAFTPGFNLTAGKTYRVLFYQRTEGDTTYPEKLKVTVGTAANSISQTTVLWNDANLTNYFYEERKADFVCPANGVYYFAFNCYSDADMWNLYVDEVSVFEKPAVDLSLNYFWQDSGLPVPRPRVNLESQSNKSGTEPELEISVANLSNLVTGERSSNVNNTKFAENVNIPIELNNVNLKAEVENRGLNAATYSLNWSVSGVNQTAFSGPSVAPNAINEAALTYSPTSRGTFLTKGNIVVTGDAVASNDSAQFRMRIYPDTFTRTIYDAGDNFVDTYVGWGSLTTRMKAGVRFTAASDTKLAGVDFICRTESATTGEFEIQVRAAGTTTTAPGAVLYTKVYNTTDYLPEGQIGDYIHFPFGDDVPVIASGSDYWITIKAPLGILYPGAVHNTGFTAGRSFYEGNTDTTVWNPLVITTERAWIMRSVEVSPAQTTFQLSVTVANGWNMVSIPGLHPTDQNVNTWWNFRDPLASVYKWSGGSYSPVTTATPTEGYWLLHSGARTYNTGDEWPAGGIQLVAHNPITVSSGWNMIGGYDNSASVSGLTTTPPGLIVPGTVYGWNGGYYNPTNLEPGYGYWILLTGSGVINPPTALKGGSTAKETNTEGWGKIIVTDASGKSYTLYSVKGEVNLMEYQLPPLPPAGLFDVRFGSGRKAEDLKTSQTIEMQGLVYPIVVKSENMDIRLQDVSGTVVNQSLKSGESVTISNSSVSKLMVSATVIPDKYSLEQNYPNPFNPSTVISFSLPEDASNVRLTIYDALGQKVAELVNGKLEAGKYQYTWNAGNNATGLYIYELRTDKFVSVKKMLMVK